MNRQAGAGEVDEHCSRRVRGSWGGAPSTRRFPFPQSSPSGMWALRDNTARSASSWSLRALETPRGRRLCYTPSGHGGAGKILAWKMLRSGWNLSEKPYLWVQSRQAPKGKQRVCVCMCIYVCVWVCVGACGCVCVCGCEWVSEIYYGPSSFPPSLPHPFNSPPPPSKWYLFLRALHTSQ